MPGALSVFRPLSVDQPMNPSAHRWEGPRSFGYQSLSILITQLHRTTSQFERATYFPSAAEACPVEVPASRTERLNIQLMLERKREDHRTACWPPAEFFSVIVVVQSA